MYQPVLSGMRSNGKQVFCLSYRHMTFSADHRSTGELLSAKTTLACDQRLGRSFKESARADSLQLNDAVSGFELIPAG